MITPAGLIALGFGFFLVLLDLAFSLFVLRYIIRVDLRSPLITLLNGVEDAGRRLDGLDRRVSLQSSYLASLGVRPAATPMDPGPAPAPVPAPVDLDALATLVARRMTVPRTTLLP